MKNSISSLRLIVVISYSPPTSYILLLTIATFFSLFAEKRMSLSFSHFLYTIYFYFIFFFSFNQSDRNHRQLYVLYIQVYILKKPTCTLYVDLVNFDV